MSETKTAPFKLPLKVSCRDLHQIENEEGFYEATFDLVEQATYAASAINSYQADQELIREMKEALERLVGAIDWSNSLQPATFDQHGHNVARKEYQEAEKQVRTILAKIRERR